MCRINCSHIRDKEDLITKVGLVSNWRLKAKFVGILVDLQGPKIRIAGFAEGSVLLQADQTFY